MEFGVLHKEVAKVCAPLFLENNFLGTEHSEKTLNGTATFIKFNNTIYLCTCRHVVEIAIGDNLETMKSIQISNSKLRINSHRLFVNKENAMDYVFYPQFRYSNCADIAFNPISAELFLSYAKTNGKTFIDLDNYREPDYSKIKYIHAFGWLDEHKEIVENTVVTKLAGSYVELQTANLNRDTCTYTAFSSLDKEHGYFFSGMSGGPVVYFDEENNDIFYIGIAFEAVPGSQKTFQQSDQSFMTGKDMMYRCLNLNPMVFSEWVQQSKWSWEFDQRLNNFDLK